MNIVAIFVTLLILTGFILCIGIIYYIGNIASSVNYTRVGMKEDLEKQISHHTEHIEEYVTGYNEWVRKEIKKEVQRMHTDMISRVNATYNELNKQNARNLELLNITSSYLHVLAKNTGQIQNTQRHDAALARALDTWRKEAGGKKNQTAVPPK